VELLFYPKHAAGHILVRPANPEERHGGPGRAGLGLKLALSRNLVEGHGGGITARSKGLGRGSELSVTLPLAQAEDLRPLSSFLSLQS